MYLHTSFLSSPYLWIYISFLCSPYLWITKINSFGIKHLEAYKEPSKLNNRRKGKENDVWAHRCNVIKVESNAKQKMKCFIRITNSSSYRQLFPLFVACSTLHYIMYIVDIILHTVPAGCKLWSSKHRNNFGGTSSWGQWWNNCSQGTVMITWPPTSRLTIVTLIMSARPNITLSIS